MYQEKSGNPATVLQVVPVFLAGNLCVEVARRRLVSGKAWALLRKYFPTCKEFTDKEPVCPQCEVSEPGIPLLLLPTYIKGLLA
jgi:hypothetical protein